MHQAIFHLSLTKLSYLFRKVKPDVRNWLTLSYSARQRPYSQERFRSNCFELLPTKSLTASSVRASCSQPNSTSGIFYLLVEVVYWLCGLKFVYPTINFAFLQIIFKVKLPAKFCLHSYEWFSPQISSNTKYFILSCPMNRDRAQILVKVYLFKSETKKEHIIRSRVIRPLMDNRYIETLSLYILLKR